MSLRCPKCGEGFSQWEIAKFLRLHSVGCRQCDSPLALSGRGRAAFVISLLGALLLGALGVAAKGDEYVIVLALLLGFVVGSITGSNYGRLYVFDEGQGDKNG